MMWKLQSGAAILVGLGLAATGAKAGIFQVSGGVQGTCPTTPSLCAATPGTIDYGGSTGPTTIDFLVTATSGDTYEVTGTESASYGAGGSVFSVDLSAAYTGMTTTAVADSFKVDVFQNIFDPSPGSFAGTYTEATAINIGPGVGTGTSVSAELFWLGQGIGLLGPYTTSQPNASASANLTGAEFATDTLSGDWQFTFNFQPGTVSGAGTGAIPSTPEPRETLPLLLMLAGGMAWAARRRMKPTMVPCEQGSRS